MKHRYFVAYSHPKGNGRCDITTDKPINSIDRVAEVEKTISEINDGIVICIDNFFLFEDAE